MELKILFPIVILRTVRFVTFNRVDIKMYVTVETLDWSRTFVNGINKNLSCFETKVAL